MTHPVRKKGTVVMKWEGAEQLKLVSPPMTVSQNVSVFPKALWLPSSPCFGFALQLDRWFSFPSFSLIHKHTLSLSSTGIFLTIIMCLQKKTQRKQTNPPNPQTPPPELQIGKAEICSVTNSLIALTHFEGWTHGSVKSPLIRGRLPNASQVRCSLTETHTSSSHVVLR